MKLKRFGQTGIEVSELCLGTSNFANLDGVVRNEIIKAFIDNGGNYFDCADVYDSEHLLSLPKDVVINSKYSCSQTKYKGNNKRSLVEAVNKTLANLKRDYIDILWVHAWDYSMQPCDIMRHLNQVIKSGKVLHVGICNTPAWIIAECNTIAKMRGWEPFSGMQVEYSLVERAADYDLLPMAKHFGMESLAWCVLARGLLAGKDKKGSRWYNDQNLKVVDAVMKFSTRMNLPPTQVAINFVRHRGLLPIIGCSNKEQLIQNLQMSDTYCEELDELTKPKLIYPHYMNRPGSWVDVRIRNENSLRDNGV